jgi:hypothetical protein
MSLFLVGALIMVAAALGVAHGLRHGDRPFVWLLFLGLAARLLVSVANQAVGPLPGADVDAVAFHDVAAGLVASGGWPSEFLGLTDRYLYANVLAVLYGLLGASPYVATAWHCLLFAMTLIEADGLLREHDAQRRWRLLTLTFLAVHLPTVLYSAVTLREAPLLFALVVFARALLRVGSARPSPIRLVLAAMVLILLNPGFVVLLVLPAFTPLIRSGVAGLGPSLVRAGVVGILGLIVVTRFDLLSIPRLARFASDSGELTAERVGEVQGVKARGEGAYTLHFPPVGPPPVSLALATPEASVRLLLSPFPWEWRPIGAARTLFKALDVVIFGASLVAFAVLARTGVRREAAVIVMLLLLLAAVFGIVTANDGVAMRHRAKIGWLIIAGAALCGARAARGEPLRSEVVA